ncbi:MAG: serine kinase [Verrucomicrobia bacterium]|nr:MAG: serine kinase [Verrucomicrobiota bacterium]
MEIQGQELAPTSLFAAARDAFAEAVGRARRSVIHDRLVGGRHVRLHFANEALVPILTPALAHHPHPPPESVPQLTVHVWDSLSTGLRASPLDWLPEDLPPTPEVRVSDGSMLLVFTTTSGILRLLNLPEKVALYWAADPQQVSDVERSTPFLLFLQGLLRGPETQVVHGAAVGTPEGCVLLAGRGGAGKSTSALACLVAGMRYVGDDYCLLSRRPEPRAFNLFNSGKLNGDSLARLPQLIPHVVNPARKPGEKAVFFFREDWGDQLAPSLPIRAVLLPRVTGGRDTTLRPASAAEGIKALAPSTIFQLTGPGATTFRMLADFLRCVPCHHLLVGTDLGQIPRAIGRLLADSDGRPPAPDPIRNPDALTR